MKFWLCTLLALAATQARAEMWSVFQGEALTAALSGQTLAYEDATQTFYASGRTRYTARQESWGYWRADGKYYCSQWPPAEEWACYTARISPDGAELRFIDPGGHVSRGTFTKQFKAPSETRDTPRPPSAVYPALEHGHSLSA